LLKVGLFAVIAAPALVNRTVLKPMLIRAAALTDAERSHATGRFVRMLGIEGALGALVLVAAALLTSLPPAEVEAAAALPVHDMAAMADLHAGHDMSAMAEVEPEPTWLTAAVGGQSVKLSIEPALVGSNRVRVVVEDASGQATDAGAVRLRVVPPADASIAPTTVRLDQADGGYRAVVMMSAVGTWTLEAQLPGGGSASFEVPVADGGAPAGPEP